MPPLAAALAVAAAVIGAPAPATVVVTVDKSAQELSVTVDGAERYHWPVSTARMGYRTPNGTYKPEWLARNHHSRQYGWAPMPYSIFFNEGYAIHGSYEVSRLGHPASHGCVRLKPENAALLYALVKDHMADTTIVIGGDHPRKAHTVDADEQRTHRKRREAEARPQGGDYQGNSWHNGQQQFFIFGSPSR